ncbi:hypothetical protein Nmel_008013 [Mimus melanotis]
MLSNLIWMFVLLCRSVAEKYGYVMSLILFLDENSIRDADIFPSSPVIERGSSLELSCVLRKNYMNQGNASHIIWKLNNTLIAPGNYNIVNETVSNIAIHNFTYSTAYVNCFMNYSDKELLLAHTEVKSGFRPDMPENISCIYFYDANLTCTWNAGRETSFATNYTLNRKLTHFADSVISCQNGTESCSFFTPSIVYNNDFCFQVVAKNVLGESSTKCIPIPLEKIEKFAPPEILSVKKIPGIKQLLTVTWKMPKKIIPSKPIICQVQYRNLYSNFTEFVNVSLNSKEATGSCNLTGLWDSTDYSVAIRCINNESAFWSGWSGEKNGSTEETAPSEKVDLWRVIESSHSSRNRPVHLMWKPLKSFPPPGKILGYKIRYFPEKKTAAHKRTNNSTEKKITLLLNEEAHIISVTAYNSAGESPEAILRIPSIDEKSSQVIETVKASTTNEEVVVEWTAPEPKPTKYVVEWYEELEMDPFGRSWQYVSNSREWKNNKKNFKPFVCYNISVYSLYGNNVAAPSYAQIYAEEKEPSEGPVADTYILGKNEVTIKWKEISKAKRNGFITSYTIFYKPEDGKELSETVNSDILQCRLKSLQANTQYTVQIMAHNRAGNKTGGQKTFKTLKFDEEDFFFFAIPVGISVLCLIGLWITCVLKKHAFKKVCWPDIPNPEESLAVEWPLAMNPVKNEENYDEEVLKLEDFSDKALFNPYLKNSVKTREFLVSENLPEQNTDECKSQSSVLPPFQPNVPRQSYVTLDMFRLAKAQ